MMPSGKRNSTSAGTRAAMAVTRVWRITESAPFGEFVEVTAQAAGQPSGNTEPIVPGWAMSSYELMSGLDVSEDPETLPNELFDKLFKR